MSDPFFYSTQVRGLTIEKRIEATSWDEVQPQIPTIKAEKPKQNAISIGMHAYNGLYEEYDEEEDPPEQISPNLQRKIQEMELEPTEPSICEITPEKKMGAKVNASHLRVSAGLSEISEQDEVIYSFGEKQQREMVREFENYRAGNSSQVNTQNTDYLRKVANLVNPNEGHKAKVKSSQRFLNPQTTSINQKRRALSPLYEGAKENFEGIDDEIDEIEEFEKTETPITKKYIKSQPMNLGILSQNNKQVISKPVLGQKNQGFNAMLEAAISKKHDPGQKWAVRILSHSVVNGITSIEYEIKDKPNSRAYAIINSNKQYYSVNIDCRKAYWLINPRFITELQSNKRKVFYVDKIEEV